MIARQIAGARGLLQDRELRAARAPARTAWSRPIIDFGPFLLALTPHSVLAAPYHRLSAGILAGSCVFAAPPDEARKLARAPRRNLCAHLRTAAARRPRRAER